MSFHTGDTVEVTTLDVAQGGWCVARPDDGPVVFVRHALPGERVRARVTEVTSRFARAEAVEILNPSSERVEAPCPSARPFGCGGCDWQHASLPAQRTLKATVISQQLRRLAGIDREVIVEPLPGDEDPAPAPADGDPADGAADADDNSKKRMPGGRDADVADDDAGSVGAVDDNSKKRQPGFGWRTRVQYAVGPDGRAGLRGHRSHEVVDIGDCLIAHPAIRDLGVTALRWPDAESVEVIAGLGRDAADHDAADPDAAAERAVLVTPRRDPRQSSGRPKREPRRGRGRDAGVSSSPERAKTAGDTAARFDEEIPDGVTAAVTAEEMPDGVTAVTAEAVLSRAGRRLTPVRGRPYLRQRAAGRDWRVSVGAFWQVHPAAAGTLSDAVVAVLDPKPGDSVLDLYCGAGLFAGALAPLVGPDGSVAGIESDEAAVRDARANLRGTPWARVHRGDVAEVLRRSGERGGEGSGQDRGRQGRSGERRSGGHGPLSARLVVADPPRAGLARAVIEELSAGAAERFAYVSCDPATLARDLGLLLERGWRLEGLRAFDAFPMTHHVECVAALAR